MDLDHGRDVGWGRRWVIVGRLDSRDLATLVNRYIVELGACSKYECHREKRRGGRGGQSEKEGGNVGWRLGV
jgi:hypothetical protein